jgi:hypothetical protein
MAGTGLSEEILGDAGCWDRVTAFLILRLRIPPVMFAGSPYRSNKAEGHLVNGIPIVCQLTRKRREPSTPKKEKSY